MASFVRMNRTNVSTAEGTSSLSDIFTKSVSLLNTPDPIYGSGIDGDATISTNTSLTSDMQYANLTINSSIVLNPNGYRIFVRDTLTMHSGSRIGYTAGFSTAGSIAQGGATNTSVLQHRQPLPQQRFLVELTIIITQCRQSGVGLFRHHPQLQLSSVVGQEELAVLVAVW